jgi:DNA topoisomerase-1
LLAAIELDELGEFDSDKQAKKNIVSAIKQVAKQLGNRPATCRKYYVHPAILETYEDGSLLNLMSETTNIESAPNDLNPEEKVVLKIIEQAIPRP